MIKPDGPIFRPCCKTRLSSLAREPLCGHFSEGFSPPRARARNRAVLWDRLLAPKQPSLESKDKRFSSCRCFACPAFSCHDLWLLHVGVEVKIHVVELAQVGDVWHASVHVTVAHLVGRELVGFHLSVCCVPGSEHVEVACLHGHFGAD